MRTFEEWALENTELLEMAHAIAWESDDGEHRAFATIRGYKVAHPTFYYVIKNRQMTNADGTPHEEAEGLTAKEIARRVLEGSTLIDEEKRDILGPAGKAHIDKIWKNTAERNKWTRDVRRQLESTSNLGKWSNLLHFEIVPETRPKKFRLSEEAIEREKEFGAAGLRRSKQRRESPAPMQKPEKPKTSETKPDEPSDDLSSVFGEL